jgi:ABC transporter substrate binding protein (PQQ-dependent alcohol dehydrogenase system)
LIGSTRREDVIPKCDEIQAWIGPVRRYTGALAVAAMFIGAGAIVYADETDSRPVFTIGYVDLAEDVRYDDWGIHPTDIRSATAIQDRRGYPGAVLGLSDIKRLERMAKASFALEHARAADETAALAAIIRLHDEQGIDFFLLDLPDHAVADIARATRGGGLVLINVSATGNALRNDDCQPHLIHIAPSRAMLIDGLTQFLVAKKWREVLVLQGPHAEDAETVAALERSAALFGLDLVEVRQFVLGSDPRARDLNDLDFLTGGADYDVVFVADVDGEFAHGVPYGTKLPVPVVGASGLVPRAWHWSHLRHGAPQVHGRFERMHDRRMNEADWGAWMGMKMVAEGVVRGRSLLTSDIEAYLNSGKARIDGSKGKVMGLRPWSNQLRQPILLTTPEWVVALAPVKGFRHRTNDLDTLGYESRDTTCEF